MRQSLFQSKPGTWSKVYLIYLKNLIISRYESGAIQKRCILILRCDDFSTPCPDSFFLVFIQTEVGIAARLMKLCVFYKFANHIITFPIWAIQYLLFLFLILQGFENPTKQLENIRQRALFLQKSGRTLQFVF